MDLGTILFIIVLIYGLLRYLDRLSGEGGNEDGSRRRTGSSDEVAYRCSECGSDILPDANYCRNCGSPLEHHLENKQHAEDHDYVPWKTVNNDVDLALAKGILEREGIEFVVDTVGNSSMFPSILARRQILVRRSEAGRASSLFNEELGSLGTDYQAPQQTVSSPGEGETRTIKLTLFQRSALRQILREQLKPHSKETSTVLHESQTHLEDLYAQLERDSTLRLTDDQFATLKTLIEELLAQSPEHSSIREIAAELDKVSSTDN